MHAHYMHQPWMVQQQRAIQQRQKQQMLRQSIRELQQTTLRDAVRDRNVAMMNQLQEIQQQLHHHDEQTKQSAMTALLERILHQQNQVERLLDRRQPPPPDELPVVTPRPTPHEEAKGDMSAKLHQPPPQESVKQTTVAPPPLQPSQARSRPSGYEVTLPVQDRPPTSSMPSHARTPHDEPPQNHQAKHERVATDVPAMMQDALFSDEEEQLLAIPEDDIDAADSILAAPTKEDAAAQDLKRHESMRRKVLLQHLNPSTNGLKRPKWRLDADAANGVVSTFGEEAMAPLQVFRSVAVAVLSVVSLQRLSLARRKSLRDEETSAMANMIQVYVEATRSWMAKEVRVPIASVLQDPTMSFDTGGGGAAEKGLKKKYGALLFATKKAPKSSPQALVQLKVRLKGIVDAITKTTHKPQDTPDAIAKFLRRVTTDGVYFPAHYLSAEERQALEFNSLGATRNMNQPRFNIVVLNFIVVRIVVLDLVLRPWEGGIGSKARPVAQVQHNLRVLATALYTLCQQVLPTVLLDAGSAPPDTNKDPPLPTTGGHTLAQIPALLFPKDALPLHDVDFTSFLIQQQEKLQTWLAQLHHVVNADQPPSKETNTNQ